MKSLFEIFRNLSWGWPREWEELLIIIVLGLFLTIVYRTSKIFMKLTIGLTVVGLIALLVYSFMQEKSLKDSPINSIPEIGFENKNQDSE